MAETRKDILLFALVVSYAIVSLYRIISTSAPDFSVYYNASKNLRFGHDIYSDITAFTQFNYPPVTAFVILPLSLIPYVTSQAMWTLASFMAFTGSVIGTLRLLDIWSRKNFMYAWIVGFISFPTRFTFGMGQINYIALFVLIVSLLMYKKKQDVISGLLLGLAMILKPQLIFLWVVLLLKKSWIVASFAMITVMSLIVISIICFGSHSWTTYISHTLPSLSVFEDRTIYYNQGLSALASRLFHGMLAQRVTLIVSIGMLTSLAGLLLFPIRIIPIFIASLPIMLLIEPYAWQHHFIFLLPVCMYIWKYRTTVVETIALCVGLLLVGINIAHPARYVSFPFSPILLSHVVIGTLVLYVLTLRIALRQLKQ